MVHLAALGWTCPGPDIGITDDEICGPFVVEWYDGGLFCQLVKFARQMRDRWISLQEMESRWKDRTKIVAIIKPPRAAAMLSSHQSSARRSPTACMPLVMPPTKMYSVQAVVKAISIVARFAFVPTGGG